MILDHPKLDLICNKSNPAKCNECEYLVKCEAVIHAASLPLNRHAGRLRPTKKLHLSINIVQLRYLYYAFGMQARKTKNQKHFKELLNRWLKKFDAYRI